MLSTRLQQIYDQFLEDPSTPLAVSDFQHLKIDRATLFRDFQKLVGEGLLTAQGKSYLVSPESDGYLTWDLTRPPHMRKVVRYDRRLLDAYIPNKTPLLSDDQLKRLEAVGTVAGVGRAAALGKPYERIISSLLIDLTHASSNFENVKISWLDTKALLEFGDKPGDLSEQQLRVVLNHKTAIVFLNEYAHELAFSKKDLCDIHTKLADGLMANPMDVGALRKIVVKFDDSKYIPLEVPSEISQAFDIFCHKANQIANPYEQAFFAMSFIAYIQPFSDVNKRTSRIAMNIPLIKNKLAPFSFADMTKRDYMFGLLALYERKKHKFLAEEFTKAYVKSARRYCELVEFINDGGLVGTISGEAPASSSPAVAKAAPENPPAATPRKTARKNRGPDQGPSR
jgi:Fic family protein